MKPRTVIITMEIVSNEKVSVLKQAMRDITSYNSGDMLTEIKQIQVNVVKETKK